MVDCGTRTGCDLPSITRDSREDFVMSYKGECPMHRNTVFFDGLIAASANLRLVAAPIDR